MGTVIQWDRRSFVFEKIGDRLTFLGSLYGDEIHALPPDPLGLIRLLVFWNVLPCETRAYIVTFQAGRPRIIDRLTIYGDLPDGDKEKIAQQLSVTGDIRPDALQRIVEGMGGWMERRMIEDIMLDAKIDDLQKELSQLGGREDREAMRRYWERFDTSLEEKRMMYRTLSREILSVLAGFPERVQFVLHGMRESGKHWSVADYVRKHLDVGWYAEDIIAVLGDPGEEMRNGDCRIWMDYAGGEGHPPRFLYSLDNTVVEVTKVCYLD